MLGLLRLLRDAQVWRRWSKPFKYEFQLYYRPFIGFGKLLYSCCYGPSSLSFLAWWHLSFLLLYKVLLLRWFTYSTFWHWCLACWCHLAQSWRLACFHFTLLFRMRCSTTTCCGWCLHEWCKWLPPLLSEYFSSWVHCEANVLWMLALSYYDDYLPLCLMRTADFL